MKALVLVAVAGLTLSMGAFADAADKRIRSTNRLRLRRFIAGPDAMSAWAPVTA